MSPDARSASTTLELLRQEFGIDLEAMARHAAELDKLLATWEQVKVQRPLLIVAAVELHAWYTAFEAAIERVARTLDRSVPAGAESHFALLRQASLALPEVRPALIPRGVFAELHELLKFRHFFRHAYRVELDPARVEQQARRLGAITTEVERSLRAFDDFVAASLLELKKR